MLDDREHLPKIVTDIDGIRDVLLAIEPEIFLLRSNISDLMKELYVKTTTNLITRWEKDFGLSYDASLTLQQRRQRILNKLARKKTLNWTNLRLLIKNNLAENSQIYLINDSENYHFRILVQDPNYQQMEKAVMEAKPAYITFDIVVTQYFRRCGTFNCGTEPL
ncbi:MAG: YmfQ family protein [Muribaculaceae bacterium]|nr:YmfQ family protein [Muribaculaceae bacterium]